MFKLLSSLTLALALVITPVYAVDKPPSRTEQTANPPKVGGIFNNLINNLLKKLQNVTLADLQFADQLAQNHSNAISHQCFTAWISYLQAEAKANTGPDGKPVTQPSPSLFTDLERALDLMHALQPTSAISVACAPFINDAKSLGISIGGVPLLP
jgi:hypothetical protein